MSTAVDVAVIGAGPAGLAAATALAEAGASVLVLDEQPAPGGQIYRAVESVAAERPAHLAALGPDYAHGLDLVRRFRASTADYRPGSSAWQITQDGEVWFSRAGASERAVANAVILATGAIERPVPLPGWTLPGVMTVGALQIMLKAGGLTPDVPTILAGSGPLLLLLAAQYAAAGVRPAAILDTAPPGRMLRALPYLPAALGATARGYLAKGLRLKRTLTAGGVPVFPRVSDIRIEGDSHVAGVSFRSAGTPHRLDARIVALHEGVIPAIQAARSLDCAIAWDDAQRCFKPRTDGWGRSSQERILIAGDAAGIGGARAAEHGGRLAAFEALRMIGRIDEAGRDRLAADDRARRKAHLAIRPLLDCLYPPPAQILHPDDGTTICRCEEVTAGALREVVAQGCLGPNQAKTFLRCGMGPCQGRLCGPTVTEVIAEARGCPPADVGYYRARPPLKPMSVGELATLAPEPS